MRNASALLGWLLIALVLHIPRKVMLAIFVLLLLIPTRHGRHR